jgi:hypothetical protein
MQSRMQLVPKPKDPEPQESELEIVTLTLGPFAGRKYVRLPNGIIGPRWYDDITKEKP